MVQILHEDIHIFKKLEETHSDCSRYLWNYASERNRPTDDRPDNREVTLPITRQFFEDEEGAKGGCCNITNNRKSLDQEAQGGARQSLLNQKKINNTGKYELKTIARFIPTKFWWKMMFLRDLCRLLLLFFCPYVLTKKWFLFMSICSLVYVWDISAYYISLVSKKKLSTTECFLFSTCVAQTFL